MVQRGEAVGLLGPNGAGKTTVFYMITGLVRPDKGGIELDGHEVTHLPMYRRARLGIGYLPQEASIFRGLSVEDNIRAVLEVSEPDRDRREAELESLLDEFDIKRLRKSPSIALSGGERRRCEIARALASDAAIILMDDPMRGVDIGTKQEVYAMIRAEAEKGRTFIWYTTEIEELTHCDRAYVFRNGAIVAALGSDDLTEEKVLEASFAEHAA